MDKSTPYDASVYVEQVAPSRLSADVVVPLVMDLLRPSSVVDAGCGAGAWLAAFQAQGVDRIVGLEGGHPSHEQLQVSAQVIRKVDLESSFDLGERFDLAISVEVAEHLPATSADSFVASLVAASDVVLFSGAVPGQGGDWHINEQWPSYWSSRFAEHGYACFDILRARIWDNEDVAWWYRQNLLLFVADAARGRLETQGFAAEDVPRALVHPDLYNMSQAALVDARGGRQGAQSLARAVRRKLFRSHRTPTG